MEFHRIHSTIDGGNTERNIELENKLRIPRKDKNQINKLG